jgi:hypothetical protein
LKIFYKITTELYLATDAGDFFIFKNRCTLMGMDADMDKDKDTDRDREINRNRNRNKQEKDTCTGTLGCSDSNNLLIPAL